MTARARSPRKRYRVDPLDPPKGEPNASIIWHALAPLDATARDLETKWGMERLQEIVPEMMAARFGMARDLLDQALADGDVKLIAEAAANLRRGWEALDKAATDAGHSPHAPEGWAFDINGLPHVVVRNNADASLISRRDPDVTIYTLEEVGRLLAVAIGQIAPTIAAIKRDFPGAEVSGTRPRTNWDPLTGGDEIPF